jgi:chromosome segregation ATPase
VEHEARVAALTTELSTLRHDVRARDASLGSLRQQYDTDVAALRQMRGLLQERLQEHETMVTDLQGRLEVTTRELSLTRTESRTTITTLQERYSREVSVLERDLTSARSTSTAASQSLVELQKTLDLAFEERAGLLRQIDSWKHAQACSEAEIQLLKRSVAGHEDELSALRTSCVDELDAARRQCTALQGEVAAAVRRAVDAEAAADSSSHAASAAAAAAKRDLDDMRRVVAQAESNAELERGRSLELEVRRVVVARTCMCVR